MIVICSLLVTVMAGDIPWQTRADTQGKVLGKSALMYRVDFRRGLRKYPKVVAPENYADILIERSLCVEVESRSSTALSPEGKE